MLNAKGQELHYKLHVSLTTLFSIIMIFYAAFRGQRVVTQLPATFRTTTTPKKLPLDFMNHMFPSRIPNMPFEYPELTICPAHPQATLNLVTCNTKTALVSTPCTTSTTKILTSAAPVMTSEKANMTCYVVSGGAVSSIEDKMVMHFNVQDLPTNAPSGVMVLGSTKGNRTWSATNLISAQSWSVTDILISKIYQIDLKNVGSTVYELNSLSIPISNINVTEYILKNYPNIQNEEEIALVVSEMVESSFPLMIEVRYPALQVTYEKTFLPLDMNNWLGEVGGMMAILFMLYSVAMKIGMSTMLKSGTFSVSALGQNKDEAFDRFA